MRMSDAVTTSSCPSLHPIQAQGQGCQFVGDMRSSLIIFITIFFAYISKNDTNNKSIAIIISNAIIIYFQ